MRLEQRTLEAGVLLGDSRSARPSSNPGRIQGSQPISPPKISSVSFFESEDAAIAISASGCM